MLLYQFIISLYFLALRLAAFFSPKAQLWVQGRRDIMPYVRENIGGQEVVWFHCSSLGEFEQGRPIMEQMRRDYPKIKILLTFFSPSGYELRKDYDVVDYVCYLPQDQPRAIRQFLGEVKPKFVVFVKYDYWFLLLQTLLTRQIPIYFVSAVIKQGHYLTKWYSAPFRRILRNVTHFYVQDAFSKEQFQGMGINQVTVAGDTRVDRVVELAQNVKPYPNIKKWVGEYPVFICGSTWPTDEEIIVPSFDKIIQDHWKIIIAPHDVSQKNVQRLSKMLPQEQVLMSSLSADYQEDIKFEGVEILIVDTIGHLNSLYQFGTIGYVGGGFEQDGLHNTLEPATFGMPLIYGSNFLKFMEAVAFAKDGGAFVLGQWKNKKNVLSKTTCQQQFESAWTSLSNPKNLAKAAEITKKYVEMNNGATFQIVRELYSNL